MYCRNCGSEMHSDAVVCVKCGVPAGKGEKYCPTCGKEVHPEAVFCVNCGAAINKSANKRVIPNSVQKRDLAKALILSIITCGIYAIYWFIKLTDEMNLVTGNEKDTSGGTAFLLNLITCGIYGIYWAYKMGQKRDSLDDKDSSSGIIYLVLAIFGLGIVVYALAQDAINKAVEGK